MTTLDAKIELHRRLGRLLLKLATDATNPDLPPEKWHKSAVRYFELMRSCKASFTLDSDPQ